MQAAVLDDGGADGDGRVHVAPPADVTDRAGIDVALDRFEFANDFQRADLRRTADGAGGKGGLQDIGEGGAGLQLALHLRHDMHHVRVAFDLETIGHDHAAGFGDAANIVAAQVDQHKVLGALLRIGQQFDFQRNVFGMRGAARAGAGDRAHGNLAVLHAHQDFRRAADHLGTVKVEEIHVGRRIERAQCAIHIHRPRAERHAHALAQHDLEDVASTDVFLHRLHGFHETVAGEAGNEIFFLQQGRVEHVRVAAAGMAQAVNQFIQASHRARMRLWLGRVCMDDEVQAALEVVEYGEFFRQHQEGIGCAELIRLVAASQARLDVADRFETEIADQPAGEGRQAGHARHAEAFAQAVHFGQGVGEFPRFDQLAVHPCFHRVAAEGEGARGRQADDGIAAPGLAALHRFEQVGMRTVGQFQVNRQRRVQVGQHLAHHGDAVMAGGG